MSTCSSWWIREDCKYCLSKAGCDCEDHIKKIVCKGFVDVKKKCLFDAKSNTCGKKTAEQQKKDDEEDKQREIDRVRKINDEKKDRMHKYIVKDKVCNLLSKARLNSSYVDLNIIIFCTVGLISSMFTNANNTVFISFLCFLSSLIIPLKHYINALQQCKEWRYILLEILASIIIQLLIWTILIYNLIHNLKQPVVPLAFLILLLFITDTVIVSFITDKLSSMLDDD